VPYGTPIDADVLRQVWQGERFLRDLGLRQLRVRHHGDIARIEVPVESLARLVEPETREAITRHFKAIGYTFVALDLEGFRSGSMNAKLPNGETVEEARAAVIAKVGENVQVRRLVRIDSANNVAAYVHGGRIGVLVEVKGGDIELARGIAMHIAAMNPPHVKAADVPAEFVAKEKEIELAKMSEKDKAKPADILEKIISGKIAKIVNEVTLYGQPYVLNTDQSVEQAVKAAGADVVGFQRLAVGEGIEKVVEDYAAEVMKQAGLA
jgi:translation elongation factor EF-Ts